MLPSSEACERNKGPILDVLRIAFAQRAQVLEIGSGTGQHAVHFAAQLPHLTWHPTEQLTFLAELTARVKLEGSRNLRPPAVLDVKQAVWPLRRVDAVFTANTMHIMAWPEVMAMYRGIGAVLTSGGVMCAYGPFRYHGRHTSSSNEAFDRMLQERDPLSGLRDMEDLTALAAQCGLRLRADHDLPSNNRLLEFVKDSLEAAPPGASVR
jgi:cyclopropane fatty-acyl-phospholipid synthase-like methyltransferase